MTITTVIKGQLTRAFNAALVHPLDHHDSAQARTQAHVARLTIARDMFVAKMHLPREQAKHAARKYLASIA